MKKNSTKLKLFNLGLAIHLFLPWPFWLKTSVWELSLARWKTPCSALADQVKYLFLSDFHWVWVSISTPVGAGILTLVAEPKRLRGSGRLGHPYPRTLMLELVLLSSPYFYFSHVSLSLLSLFTMVSHTLSLSLLPSPCTTTKPLATLLLVSCYRALNREPYPSVGTLGSLP